MEPRKAAHRREEKRKRNVLWPWKDEEDLELERTTRCTGSELGASTAVGHEGGAGEPVEEIGWRRVSASVRELPKPALVLGWCFPSSSVNKTTWGACKIQTPIPAFWAGSWKSAFYVVFVSKLAAQELPVKVLGNAVLRC